MHRVTVLVGVEANIQRKGEAWERERVAYRGGGGARQRGTQRARQRRQNSFGDLSEGLARRQQPGAAAKPRWLG
jgi:hypothetical protein